MWYYLQRPTKGYSITANHCFPDEEDIDNAHLWMVMRVFIILFPLEWVEWAQFHIVIVLYGKKMWHIILKSIFGLVLQCYSCGDLIKKGMNGEPSPTDCIEMLDGDDCANLLCRWHRYDLKELCLFEGKMVEFKLVQNS